MDKLTFGSLFAGIGGIDLGLERAGMTCKWQVEIDDYCQRVLNKHWPDVEKFRDVKEVHGVVAHAEGNKRWDKQKNITTSNRWESRGKPGQGSFNRRIPKKICPTCLPPVDVIAGGFPCQPHSVAGKRKGAADDRNLWPEYLRIIKELRPTWVLGENVPGIRTTYLDTVLSDLESEGYATRTFNIPAVAFDAQHLRYRIFVVAHSSGAGLAEWEGERKNAEQKQQTAKRNGFAPNAENTNWRKNGKGEKGRPQGELGRSNSGASAADSWWPTEPNVGRVAHGVPNRVDRLRGLGNAVVPQVAEFMGRAIVEAHNSLLAS